MRRAVCYLRVSTRSWKLQEATICPLLAKRQEPTYNDDVVTSVVQLLDQANVLLDGRAGGVISGHSGHTDQGHVEIEAETALLQLNGQVGSIRLEKLQEVLELLGCADNTEVLGTDRHAQVRHAVLDHEGDHLGSVVLADL